MAGSTVPEHSYASVVNTTVSSKEVGTLIDGLERARRTGRPGYGSRALIGACIARSVYALPTWVRTTRLIAEHAALKAALGAAPSVGAVYRFTRKLRGSLLLRACLDRLIGELARRAPEYGRDLAIDSTDLPAYANGQRFKYRGGPEREAFSDPDASWGHRSAVSTRKGGGFYGFKLHMAACAVTGLPVAWAADTGRTADMRHVTDLLDQARAIGIEPKTAAMDGGYDFRSVFRQCEERGVLAAVSKRSNSGTGEGPIPRRGERFKALYRGRTAVEREFGRLKYHHGLSPLRTRGLDRVQLHVDLVMLARLARELLAV